MAALLSVMLAPPKSGSSACPGSSARARPSSARRRLFELLPREAVTINRVMVVDTIAPPAEQLSGEAEPSEAGPIDEREAATLADPPMVDLPRPLQVLRFSQRQIE